MGWGFCCVSYYISFLCGFLIYFFLPFYISLLSVCFFFKKSFCIGRNIYIYIVFPIYPEFPLCLILIQSIPSYTEARSKDKIHCFYTVLVSNFISMFSWHKQLSDKPRWLITVMFCDYNGFCILLQDKKFSYESIQFYRD